MTVPLPGPGTMTRSPGAPPAVSVDPRPRWRRLRGPLLLAGGLLGASLLLHLRDPHRTGSYGFCPWWLLTGTYCPGCGGLRAVNDLGRGNLRAGASSNLLLVGTLPLLLVLWARALLRRWRGVVPPRAGQRVQLGWAATFLGVAVTFAVLRNLPVGAWLAP